MNPKSNPAKISDENPEADDQWFSRARPASDVLPELFGNAVTAEMLKPKNTESPSGYSNQDARQYSA